MTSNNFNVGKMPSLKWLKVEEVRVPENRLRSRIKGEAFQKSIEDEDVKNPIFVFEDGKGFYWLADGQNRLEAVKRKDKPLIKAYVEYGTEADALLY